jgi:hypothetical protein
LQRRLYKFKKKHVRKDGTVTIGPNRQWKWVKGETKQRKYRPRGQAKTLWSKRFGYLDTYTYNERKLLICPSGYTFGQGMHALHRLWFAYKSSKSEANIAKMEHYARAIQEVQEDMGLKTTSFPHLGIYGDVLVFRDYKTGQYGEEIDHSELKEKQELEEEKEKFEEIAPLIEQEIEKAESEAEQEEEIVTIADKIPNLYLKQNTGLGMKTGCILVTGEKKSGYVKNVVKQYPLTKITYVRLRVTLSFLLIIFLFGKAHEN